MKCANKKEEFANHISFNINYGYVHYFGVNLLLLTFNHKKSQLLDLREKDYRYKIRNYCF